MPNKQVVGPYLGFIVGALIGGILILVSLIGKINILNGAYLFFVSMPFFVFRYTAPLHTTMADWVSSIVFGFLVLVYFGLVGQVIFTIKSNPKSWNGWILLVGILLLNVLAWQSSVRFLSH